MYFSKTYNSIIKIVRNDVEKMVIDKVYRENLVFIHQFISE